MLSGGSRVARRATANAWPTTSREGSASAPRQPGCGAGLGVGFEISPEEVVGGDPEALGPTAREAQQRGTRTGHPEDAVLALRPYLAGHESRPRAPFQA